jgi:prephenate dehydratase
LVLKRSNEVELVNGANKSSIYFQTNHSKGILSKVLTAIARADINLSKLQSMPIPGSNFKYGFFADMEFEQKKQLDKMLKSIELMTNSVKLFGVYKKGKLIKG